MKASVKILTVTIFSALVACSSQEVKQEAGGKPETVEPVVSDESLQLSGQNPAMTITKNGKTLNLVRIMDGGACKNELQGVKGVFLIYADPDDIDRIKREKGPAVFAEFENKIQAFSSTVLEDTVNAINLAEDPFALGEDEAQQKLAKKLSIEFRRNIAVPAAEFQKETSLNIEVAPFPPSLIFYQKGCDAARLEPGDQSNGPE